MPATARPGRPRAGRVVLGRRRGAGGQPVGREPARGRARAPGRCRARRPRGAPGAATPAGHVLAEHARAVTARLDAAERDLVDVLGQQARRLRLGSVPTALASFVPGAIARLRAERPDLTLTVVDDHVQGLLPRLRERELDLAVVFTAPESGDLGPDLGDGPAVRRTPTGSWCPTATASPGPSRTRRLRDLRDESWVGGAGGSTWFRVVRDACRAQGFEPRVGVVSDDHVAVQAFVAAGLGVAVVPGLAAALRVRGVTARDVRGPGPVRQLAVALPVSDYRTDATTRMTELLQRATRGRR